MLTRLGPHILRAGGVILAALLLLGVGVGVAAADPNAPRDPVGLDGGKLTDEELSGISARGVPHGTAPPGSPAVIIWDEAPGGKVTLQNSSSGRGGSQVSTVNVHSR